MSSNSKSFIKWKRKSVRAEVLMFLVVFFSGQVSSDKNQPYWIGLHDRKGENEFHWLDETSTVRGSASNLLLLNTKQGEKQMHL